MDDGRAGHRTAPRCRRAGSLVATGGTLISRFPGVVCSGHRRTPCRGMEPVGTGRIRNGSCSSALAAAGRVDSAKAVDLVGDRSAQRRVARA